VNANKLALALSLCLVTSIARADEPAPPPTPEAAPEPTPTPPEKVVTEADVLFQDGKRLLEAGRFVEACDKLARSDALDPAIGTRGLLAACHEQQGRIATAWREYGETAARAEAANDDRAAFARERERALFKDLPRLRIRLAKARPGVEIYRSGIRLAPEEVGAASPVDPGTYEVIARFSDKPEVRLTVTALRGKTVEVEIPDPDGAAAAAPVAAPGDAQPVVPAKGLSNRKIGAIVAGGVGLVGFGLTGIFAASASSRNAASEAYLVPCGRGSSADCEAGRALREDALEAATFANIGFGFGVAGAATAIILVLLPDEGAAGGPRKTGLAYGVAPWVSRDSGGAFISGHF